MWNTNNLYFLKFFLVKDIFYPFLQKPSTIPSILRVLVRNTKRAALYFSNMLQFVGVLHFILTESAQSSDIHTPNYNHATSIGVENSTYRRQIQNYE